MMIKKKHIVFLTFFIIVIVSTIFRVLPYIVRNENFEIGFDVGRYEYVVQKYMESDRLENLPAYPKLDFCDENIKFWMEPSFFVLTKIIFEMTSIEVKLFFRYYLQILLSIIFSLQILLLIYNINKKYSFAIFGVLLISTSYIQYEAINESLYKQLFGSILLYFSVFVLDRFLKTEKNSYLVIFVILSSSLVGYHRGVYFLLSVILFIIIIFYFFKKNNTIPKKLINAYIFVVILSSIIWVPLFESFFIMIKDTINKVYKKIYFKENIDPNYIGSIPRLIRNYDNVIIGYYRIFIYIFLIFIFCIIHNLMLKKNILIIFITMFLNIYIFFELFFSSRYLINLDFFIVIIISSVGFINKKSRIFLMFFILIFLFNFAFEYQYNRRPYIHDIDGIFWIEKNIEKNNTLIFAPDYIATSLHSMGYKVGMYCDEVVGRDPLINNNKILVMDHENNLYFLDDLKNTRNYSIYFIFGGWNERYPLNYVNKTIDVGKYENPMFENIYRGKSQIKYIYKYVGNIV